MMNAQSSPEKPEKSNEAGKSVPDNAANKQSELAALILALKGGTVDSGTQGIATAKTGAGTAEATLLGSIALNHIAHKIAKALLAEKLPSTYILATSKNVPDFRAIYTYEAQLSAIKITMDIASISADEAQLSVMETAIDSDPASIDTQIADTAPSKEPPDSDKALFENIGKNQATSRLTTAENEITDGIPLIGPALVAASNIFSYTKTDYTFASLDVTADDTMLLRALAGKLTDKTIEIPEIYSPDIRVSLDKINHEITDVSKRINHYKNCAKTREKSAASSSDDSAQKGALQKQGELSDTWNAISKSFDTWVKQLTTSDDKGSFPMATISLQKSIKDTLDDGAALVILELHSMKGDSYTKKSLWSSLGANPFFVMGEALASYIVLDGNKGKVLGSQLLPRHGGYHSVSDIEKIVNHD